jgi:ABC-type transport system involved in cytochrome bd biosynthesis fused ATPase/permease subunit
MKNLEVKIEILGQTATGKSTIAYLLSRFLKDHGFIVNSEYDEDISSLFVETLDKKIEAIKEHTIIKIKQTQTIR